MISVLLDTDYLERISDGDQKFLMELFRTYARDTSLRIEKIHTAIETQDIKELQIQAHTLKGASMNVGALRLKEKAEQIEKFIKDGNLASVEAEAIELNDLLDETRKLFKQRFF